VTVTGGPAWYEIRVAGVLDSRWAAWFDGLAINGQNEETVIFGLLTDQPALHGLLIKVRDLGLILISVRRLDPHNRQDVRYGYGWRAAGEDKETTMTDERSPGQPGIITKLSPRPVTDTVSRLADMIAAKGMKLFAVIDQSAEAARVGLQLRDTTLVIFGSPTAGTPVMEASPLAALDLPLKILIWDDDRQTKVSYTAPTWLAARYKLSDELAANLAGIEPLTDALIAG
jgi:uncharacterized protein (DUF302 family)